MKIARTLSYFEYEDEIKNKVIIKVTIKGNRLKNKKGSKEQVFQ